MKHLSKTHCPTCLRDYPPGFLDELRLRRNRNIEAALARAKAMNLPVGRPRHTPYEAIYTLYDEGMNQRRIADHLHISRGSVQHALRVRAKVDSMKGERESDLGVTPHEHSSPVTALPPGDGHISNAGRTDL